MNSLSDLVGRKRLVLSFQRNDVLRNVEKIEFDDDSIFNPLRLLNLKLHWTHSMFFARFHRVGQAVGFFQRVALQLQLQSECDFHKTGNLFVSSQGSQSISA